MIHYQTYGTVIDKKGEIGKFVIFATFKPHNYYKVLKQPEISDNYMQKSKNITASGLIFD